ncbi:MAG: cation-translocating P-type ATPase, partial [Bdellovibrionales bacterium]|nr:cation-translocating P-type ATPase [Bdellovibrionales bacterium]
SRLSEMGILVKDASALERISNVKDVYFDKTGTLTEPDKKEVRFSRRLDSNDISILMSIENGSRHPYAKQLQKKFSNYQSLDIENWQEVPGSGPKCCWRGDLYEIRPRQDQLRGFSLLKNGDLYFEVEIGETPKVRLEKTLSELKNWARLHLISGDKKSSVESFLQSQKQFSGVHAEIGPEAKAAIVSEPELSAFVGDGVNDLLVLASVSVGVSMGNGIRETIDQSDVVIGDGSLEKLLFLWRSSHEYTRSVAIILGISIFYNLTFSILSIYGFVSPLFAAIIMPMSSAFVVAVAGFLGSGRLLSNQNQLPLKLNAREAV